MRVNVVRVICGVRNLVVCNKVDFILVQKFIAQFPWSIAYNLGNAHKIDGKINKNVHGIDCRGGGGSGVVEL